MAGESRCKEEEPVYGDLIGTRDVGHGPQGAVAPG